MSQRQINIRLSSEVVDVLEAAAFARRMSVPELLKPLIEAEADALRASSAIQAALRGRAEWEAREAGTLSSLDEHRLGGEPST